MSRVLIVGGGLTGLAAAREAERRGLDWTLFEASGRLGGRVATDSVDGFSIDAGFQVLLTSYPSLAEHVDHLGLGRFEPGALVRLEGPAGVTWVPAIDPWRKPLGVFSFSWTRAVPLKDALKVARLRAGIARDDPRADQRTTAQYLATLGFSPTAMQRFLVPFFGGVLLDRELSAPAAFMRRLFAYFSRGDAAIPQGGMGRLAERLAEPLPPHRIHLHAPVARVGPFEVTLSSGGHHQGEVILCTEPEQAARLTGDSSLVGGGWHATTTFYYSPRRLPEQLQQPLLVLSGSDSVIHHLAPLSVVTPSLAPAGRHLVSVSHDGVADKNLEPQVGAELRRWFPETGWDLVAVTPIAKALPRWSSPPVPYKKLSDGLIVAGDGVSDRSIEGALSSGRDAVVALA